MNRASGGLIRGLPPNVLVLAGATFLLALGESAWFRFAPRYLEALGASALIVGLWASLTDLLDASWQFPGGSLTDRLGAKRALVLLTGLSLVGIVLFLVPAWPLVLFGLVFYMTQTAYGQPATFAVIGESLPRQRRAVGFVIQSLLKRLPLVLGAPIAGYLITNQLGVIDGVRVGLLVAGVATTAAIIAQAFYYHAPSQPPELARLRFGMNHFSPTLRRLLVSDILVRMGESATKVFIVLYVVTVLGFSDFAFGLLLALQTLVSLLVYLPVARWGGLGSRKPWVLLTFAFFALYPLTILGAKTLPLLALAFVVGGLREIGEPARKASIVDLAPADYRGRVVGSYYAVRGFSIVPMGVVAGVLWTYHPAAPFLAGCLLSGAGFVLYAMTVPRE